VDEDQDQGLTAGALPPSAMSFVVPGVPAEWTAAELAARHASHTGTHSHPHPAYGSQGSDATHEHMHAHDGDSSHSHDHGDAATISAGGWAQAAPELAELLASAHAGVPEGGSLVAAAMSALGSPWGLEQRGEQWTVLGRDGDVATFAVDDDTPDPRARAVAELGRLAFADQAQRPVLADTWRSEMCYEGQQTPDGRLMEPGALEYRDVPMPLMLQTTTDVGHYGAVLAGAINQAATVGGVAIGSGEFDDTEAGRQFQQIVDARGRFGVSIDGTFPAQYEVECVEYDEDGWCNQVVIRFQQLTVGGLTGTPFPAFPDAYIALERRAEQASGEHHGAEGEPRGQADTPCEDCAGPPAVGEPAAAGTATEVARADNVHSFPAGHTETGATGHTETITAAAAPAQPPQEWFTDPGFAVGDGRVVLQPDGRHHACPLTVQADGRVYGHMATWFTCHTGYQNACVTPPRSKTSYAGFLLRPLMTASGDVVHVGHLTMGCGHASTDGRLAVEDVRAHYDGGPGAVRMAHVACGEDQFGIWFAGALNPEATPEQVREFAACSVSGDWREVWRGKGLDLVACLAGVTVPGFPVASALAAAGLQVAPLDAARALPSEPRTRFVDGRPTVLVAAGVVRRQAPWDVLHAEDQRRMDLLEERLQRAELVTGPLRPLAGQALAASIDAVAVPAATNGHR
jgi:hypothetical protein